MLTVYVNLNQRRAQVLHMQQWGERSSLRPQPWVRCKQLCQQRSSTARCRLIKRLARPFLFSRSRLVVHPRVPRRGNSLVLMAVQGQKRVAKLRLLTLRLGQENCVNDCALATLLNLGICVNDCEGYEGYAG